MLNTTLVPAFSPDSVSLGVADETLAELRERFIGLTAETPAKYEQVRAAIADLRTVRVDVEKSRKELKADALEFGKRVDAEAKRITNALLEIEEPLKLEKQRIDDEKDRLRREKAEQERSRIEAELEARRLKAEEERQRIEAERKAEQDRIEAEQAAERERLALERQELDRQRAEIEAKQREAREAQEVIERAERERLDAERRQIEAERRQLDQEIRAEQERRNREEFERQAKLRAEQEARERLEQERIEAERVAVAMEAEVARLDALRPDVDKLRSLVEVLRAIQPPNVTTREGKVLSALAMATISDAANAIETDVMTAQQNQLNEASE